MILHAPYLLPITKKPIISGALFIKDGIIVDVGDLTSLRIKYPRQTVRTFKNSILLPGFVNAHCHLEFTHLTHKIKPARSFAKWAKKLESKVSKDTPAKIRQSLRQGEEKLLKSGVTTVVDHLNPFHLPYCPHRSPLRRIKCARGKGRWRK